MKKLRLETHPFVVARLAAFHAAAPAPLLACYYDLLGLLAEEKEGHASRVAAKLAAVLYPVTPPGTWQWPDAAGEGRHSQEQICHALACIGAAAQQPDGSTLWESRLEILPPAFAVFLAARRSDRRAAAPPLPEASPKAAAGSKRKQPTPLANKKAPLSLGMPLASPPRGGFQKSLSEFLLPAASHQKAVEQATALFRPFFVKQFVKLAPLGHSCSRQLTLHAPKKAKRHAACNPLKMKLFQFHDNYRPAYFGTHRKPRPPGLSCRRPTAQATADVDYEVDSDEEWEEEELGDVEIIGSEEEEDEEEPGASSDVDGFLVPDSYIGGSSEPDLMLAAEQQGKPKKRNFNISPLLICFCEAQPCRELLLVHYETLGMPRAASEPEAAHAFTPQQEAALRSLLADKPQTARTLHDLLCKQLDFDLPKSTFKSKLEQLAIKASNGKWRLR